MKIKKVALSILNTKDYSKFFEAFKNNGMEYLHCDVMDGKFVPNTSLMNGDYKNLVLNSPFKNDVHLMTKNPVKEFKKFANFKADIITAHYESFKTKFGIKRFIKLIKKHKLGVGLSIKPNTPCDVLKPFLDELDLVLIMSVEPGLGGQKFMTNSLEKIQFLYKEKKENNFSYLIEIDGGINSDSLSLIPKDMVDLFVMGTYFTKAENLSEAIEKIKNV